MDLKRLAAFLSVGMVGVVLLLVGLGWDALLHADDPMLAAREGVVALGNPGHVLLGAGMIAVIIGLVGASATALAAAGGRLAGDGARLGLVAASMALVLAAAGVTTLSAGAGHDGAGGHRPSGITNTDHESAGPGPEPAARHGHQGPSASATAEASGPHLDGHAPTEPAGIREGRRALGPAHAGHLSAGRGLAGAPAAVHATHPAARPAGGHDHAVEVTPAPEGGGHGHDGGPSGQPSGQHSGQPSGGGSHDDDGGPSDQPSGGGSHDHDGGPADQTEGSGGHDHDGGQSGPPGGVGDGLPGSWVEVRYGPFVLPPAGLGGLHDAGNVVMPNAPKPCEDCFIVEARPDLVYADGRSANYDTGVMLHHAVFFNSGKADTTCGGDEFFRNLGERFMASGNERTAARLPDGYGYRLGADPVTGIFHVMNRSDVPQTVWFQYKVRYLPGSNAGIKAVTPLWLDVSNCSDSEYGVPAGESSTHWRWRSTITGRIVWTGGHVHDGGVRTTLTNTTTARHVCTAWAGYGTKAAYMGSIESMSSCTWDALGTVRAGDILDLESAYDAAAADPGAMGIMVAFVHETADLGGGTPAPAQARGASAPPATSTPPKRQPHPH